MKYVDGGGSLLICGAENARLVSNLFGIQIAAKPEKRDFFVADASGFAELGGDWLELNGSNASVDHAFRSADTRKDPIPLGISIKHGSGTAVLCPAPFCSAYAGAPSPIFNNAMRQMLSGFRSPCVRFDRALPSMEVVLRKRNGQLLVHLVNTAGAPESADVRHTGIVPPVGPMEVKIRLVSRPEEVVLESAGTTLNGKHEGGEWSGVVPEIGIHTILRVKGVWSN